MTGIVPPIVDALTVAGLSAHDTSVDEQDLPPLPYVLVWAPPTPRPAGALTGRRSIASSVGLTGVGASANAVRKVLAKALAAVDNTPIVADDGTRIEMAHSTSEDIDRYDRLTLADGSHPFYGVDTYDALATTASTPLEES